MNTEEFEQLLQRQSPRPIPAQWRSEILAAAREASRTKAEAQLARGSEFSGCVSALKALLWPCPQAWAGLAAVWVAIFALHVASQEKPRRLAKHQPPPSAQALASLKEQNQLLLELLGPPVPAAVAPPRIIAPPPRSERRTRVCIV